MTEYCYDVAIQSLSTYLGHVRDTTSHEQAGLAAIPGFRQAQHEHSKRIAVQGPWEIPVQFQESFEAVYAETAEQHREQATERAEVVALFAQLSEADIRRMFAEYSQLPHTTEVSILYIFSMIAASRNTAAIEPLVERLRADVIYPVKLESEPQENPLSSWIYDRLPDSWTMRQTLLDLKYCLDRTKTIGVLACLGGSRAAEAIQPFLNDSHDQVRAAAQKALDRMAANDSPDATRETPEGI